MGLHWSLPLLESLLPADVHARLKEAANDPFSEPKEKDALPVFDGQTGEIMVMLPLGRNIRYSRKKLRTLCSHGIDVQVRYFDDNHLPSSIYRLLKI